MTAEQRGGGSGRARTGGRKSVHIDRQERSKTRGVLSVVTKAISEASFQRSVRTTLRQLGYVVWVFPIMKRTVAGVPDLTFWSPQRPGRLYFWELKTERGKVRPEQVVSIAHLSTVPGVDARIVRPSQWPELRDALIVEAIAPQLAGEDA